MKLIKSEFDKTTNYGSLTYRPSFTEWVVTKIKNFLPKRHTCTHYYILQDGHWVNRVTDKIETDKERIAYLENIKDLVDF